MNCKIPMCVQRKWNVVGLLLSKAYYFLREQWVIGLGLHTKVEYHLCFEPDDNRQQTTPPEAYGALCEQGMWSHIFYLHTPSSHSCLYFLLSGLISARILQASWHTSHCFLSCSSSSQSLETFVCLAYTHWTRAIREQRPFCGIWSIIPTLLRILFCNWQSSDFRQRSTVASTLQNTEQGVCLEDKNLNFS